MSFSQGCLLGLSFQRRRDLGTDQPCTLNTYSTISTQTRYPTSASRSTSTVTENRRAKEELGPAPCLLASAAPARRQRICHSPVLSFSLPLSTFYLSTFSWPCRPQEGPPPRMTEAIELATETTGRNASPHPLPAHSSHRLLETTALHPPLLLPLPLRMASKCQRFRGLATPSTVRHRMMTRKRKAPSLTLLPRRRAVPMRWLLCKALIHQARADPSRCRQDLALPALLLERMMSDMKAAPAVLAGETVVS